MPADVTPTTIQGVFAPGCDRFIRDDGTFGPWGNFVAQKISSEHPELLHGGLVDMDPTCPAYDGFDTMERKQFWVYVMASMTMAESGCQTEIKNSKATMGTAAGLMQLNLKGDCEGYTRRDYDDPLKNLSCALNWVAIDVGKRGALFNDDSHFQASRVLGGAKTQDLINQYADCQSEPGDTVAVRAGFVSSQAGAPRGSRRQRARASR